MCLLRFVLATSQWWSLCPFSSATRNTEAAVCWGDPPQPRCHRPSVWWRLSCRSVTDEGSPWRWEAGCQFCPAPSSVRRTTRDRSTIWGLWRRTTERGRWRSGEGVVGEAVECHRAGMGPMEEGYRTESSCCHRLMGRVSWSRKCDFASTTSPLRNLQSLYGIFTGLIRIPHNKFVC